ncbi:hypothetical protein ABZY44_17655 [Streptomyces sp. NPDC006544]|uniref:hypothetical protein n=1 Tax=Streptomyces sp. NPDC006544 TaxID=3154583 RepID=UPI0033BDA2B6
MLRILRSRTLRALRAELAQTRTELDQARTDVLRAGIDAAIVTDSAIRAETTVEELREALARATADIARAEGELLGLRSHALLDTEDRAVLRTLLRTARKQAAALDRVYALFHHGRLHSVHATSADAEAAAESEGAPRDGWTSLAPGSAFPPAAEVTWRIQPLSFGVNKSARRAADTPTAA